MRLSDSLTIIPVLHGKAVFSRQIRSVCLEEKFDCIAIDIPDIFEQDLIEAVEALPVISAVCARENDERVYYIPIDPCDATIEGIRQSFQLQAKLSCIGYPELASRPPMPPVPDEYASEITGIDIYNALCVHSIGNPEQGSENDLAGQFIASHILSLLSKHKKVLVIVHFRNFVRTIHHLNQEISYNRVYPKTPDYEITTRVINPDHLYFALGELPFVTGKFEKERYDLFAENFDIINVIKDLFRETRDEYFDNQDDISSLSPVRIQAALTFLRNLTVMSNLMIPSLMDIIESAKGVGGNAYAIRILKSAKYYPFFSPEDRNQMHVGIDKVSIREWGNGLDAINLFRDTELSWRTISIKPDPSLDKKVKYRYSWNPYGMCSHVPEDKKIEHFNSHIRTKAIRILTEDYVKNEKFTSSVKDGIDIRETLRNWHTGNIYVKEIPPSRGKIDTVVIIFDENHDDLYPHCTTWYAEHPEESTLSFYATDPFVNLIGPGIAECNYGGLALLFPPKSIPNVFAVSEFLKLKNLAARLTYGSMLFSREKNVAYVAAKKPGIELKNLASKLGKHLIWIPLSSFSNETLRKLRKFHILNGKDVRSWASRFIGD
ncbi:MAG: hypothetical protein GX639_10375 [Fibrobacter sp.]|nr:hypothetical protein [Fibrobacter sp.]